MHGIENMIDLYIYFLSQQLQNFFLTYMNDGHLLAMLLTRFIIYHNRIGYAFIPLYLSAIIYISIRILSEHIFSHIATKVLWWAL